MFMSVVCVLGVFYSPHAPPARSVPITELLLLKIPAKQVLVLDDVLEMQVELV